VPDPLTVVTDGRAFTARAGGVRRYVSALFEAMAVRDDVRIVAAGATAGLPSGVRARAARPSLPTNLGWCATGLPLSARGQGDVFHAPAYTAPLWGARPLVLTIHDVSYARRPEWYPYRLGPVRRAFYRHSARRADWILTDSEFSRGEIEAAYRIPRDRIAVVPLGVDAQFAPRTPHSAPRTSHCYVLHVGDLHPRRQLGMVLDLVLHLRTQEAWRSLGLVLVGRDLGDAGALLSRARDAGHPDAVVHHTDLSERALVETYQHARALVYPSRYEGFGLPALEAMACGIPVLAADAGALPEIVGDAGVLLPADDARAWAEALAAVLGDDARASRMAAAGLARASQFRWSRTAAATVDVYRHAIAGRQRRMR
jgi:glycosyltransferase involved in cell wall biosynthesis